MTENCPSSIDAFSSWWMAVLPTIYWFVATFMILFSPSNALWGEGMFFHKMTQPLLNKYRYISIESFNQGMTKYPIKDNVKFSYIFDYIISLLHWLIEKINLNNLPA